MYIAHKEQKKMEHESDSDTIYNRNTLERELEMV